MKKILLAGDSTVTEQPKSEPYDPVRSYCGWGQMLGQFFPEAVEIHNFAKGGASTAGFRAEGLFQALLEALDEGDFVLIQFGHNDQKQADLRPERGYTDGLRSMIDEIRQAGGHPFFVTPAARNSWRGDSGEYNNLLAPYARAMEMLAHRLDVPLLDLNESSARWVKGLGLQAAKRYFFPGDYTHPNVYGGFQWARFVAEAIASCEDRALRALLHPRERWPEMDISPNRAHALYGWICPPQRRESYADWDSSAYLTRLAALEMAMRGYGYFATTATEDTLPLVYRAAMENGYLPPNAVWTRYDETIPATDFQSLMLLAATGRNVMPPEARFLALDATADGLITGTAAAAYARALETACTGCADAS